MIPLRHAGSILALVALVLPGALIGQGPAQPCRDQVQLIRELAIGGDADRPEYEFISIGSAAVTRSGTVFVSVADGPTTSVIRRYDAAGTYRGAVGRMGAGPGEYRFIEGLGIAGDSLLVVLEFGQRRVIVYDTAGTYRRSFRVAGGGWSGLKSFVVHADGTIGVRARSVAGSSSDVMGSMLVRYRLNGDVVDSLALPPVPVGGMIMMHRALGPRWPFAARTVFAPLPRGGLATAHTMTYRVEVAPTSGARYAVERNARPVPLEDEERAEWEAMNSMGPPRPREGLPRHKPFIRELLADAEGRIWVSLYTVATRRVMPPRPGAAGRAPSLSFWEHNAYDMFDERGRFLGRVDLPPFSKLLTVAGDRAWVAEETEDGGFLLVRYRLGFPPAG